MRISLKVITRAKKEGIEKISENSYRMKVSPPPEKGKANKRVIELLSEEFDIKKQDIRIVSGKTSSRKIIEIGL
jgi:uncharacterized protein